MDAPPPTLAPHQAAHRNDWRRTIWLFAATGLIESLAFGHLSAFTPIYLRELRVPVARVPQWTGILSSLGFVIGLPLLPFWGVWADRFGRKIIIVRSSFFAALIYGLSAASPNVWWLAAARFLGGFVLGNTGVMMAVQADITPRDRLGSAVAIISAGSPVGMAIGPLLGGQIVQQVGVRALLWMDTGLTVLIVAALLLLLHDEPRPARAEHEGYDTARQGVVLALRAITHAPAVAALFTTVFLMAFGMSMAQPYLPILIGRLYRGANLAPTIGAVLTASGVSMAIATPLWGRLGDRAGHLAVWRGCALAVGLALAGQAMASTVGQIAVARAAQGLFQGGWSALAMVLLALYAPRERRAAILPLSLLPNQLAWFLGPLAGSLLPASALRFAFWGAAAAVGLGLLASERLPAPEA